MLKNILKKLKINKIVKICSYILVVLVLILLLAEVSLRYFLPLPSVKAKILEKVSTVIGAKLTADKISAGLLWIEIDNVALDTGKDSLLTCKSLKVRQNFLKLFKGQVSLRHIHIDDPELKIIRYKDGSFNFDELLKSSPEKEEETTPSQETSAPLGIKIKHLAINRAHISYIDLKDDLKAEIKDFGFSLEEFCFDKPFNLKLSFEPYFEQKNMIFEGARFILDAQTNLNNLDLKGASFDLKNFLINYKQALFKLDAKVNNFENPSITFNTELKNISQETLSAFSSLPDFNLPLTTIQGSLDYNMQKSQLAVKNLDLKAEDTEINLKADLDISKNTVSNGKIAITTVLESLNDVTPLVKEFNPSGFLKADFDFAWPLVLAGNLTLKNTGLLVDKVGTFENINTQVEVKSIDEINVSSLSGALNKNPFNAQASYLKKKDLIDIFFDFKADKLYILSSAKEAPAQQEQPSTAETAKQENKQNASNIPININAKVDIKKLDIPYIKGKNLLFNANAKNITSQMDKTHGTFGLAVKDGQIKDVYNLTDANAVTKVMFMSLGIVSRVINALNVLDLLNGIGKVLVGSKGEQDNDEILEHQEINGKLDFDSFETNVDFNQGFATMKKCSFVSDLFSFRVNGNINFDNRKIKLNVDSAPGKHTADGIMPLTIDIKGTIEEPKGSLSVLSSVSTLVGDTVINNPVSNMLKKGWGKLFSSSKDEEEVIEQEPLQQEQNTTQNVAEAK